MKIISVNVGLPRLVEYKGEFISTGIFKEPIAGKVRVNEFNLEGDGQADLRYHGGWSKAVYAYPSEHYAVWRQELTKTQLTFGIFGENLTTEGLLEEKVFIGDKFRIGTAEMVVTEPRFPCSKLGLRFGRKDIIRRFQQSRRSGFYLAVTKTGELAEGVQIELIERKQNQISVTDVVRAHDNPLSNPEILKSAIELEFLPDSYKLKFKKHLSKITKTDFN